MALVGAPRKHWWRTGGEFKRGDERVKPKDPVNHDFFALTSEKPAYWAGFLYADGCIIDGNYTPRINIELSCVDSGHLLKFVSDVGSSAQLRYRSMSGHNMCSISIGSDAMVRDLRRFGVIPRKTYLATPGPDVENDRHFWRGVIDGDGTIGLHRGFPKIQLVGCGDTCKKFLQFIKNCGVYTKATVRKYDGSASSVITIAGATARDVISILYSGSVVHLDRKKELANTMCELDCRMRFRPGIGYNYYDEFEFEGGAAC